MRSDCFRLIGRIFPSYTKKVGRRDPLESCIGFEWDDANLYKNWELRRVTAEEAEDVFFREPLIVKSEVLHSKAEKRYYCLGQTGRGRRLFVVFTIRRKLIRVISARDMNRKELETYRRYEEASA